MEVSPELDEDEEFGRIFRSSRRLCGVDFWYFIYFSCRWLLFHRSVQRWTTTKVGVKSEGGVYLNLLIIEYGVFTYGVWRATKLRGGGVPSIPPAAAYRVSQLHARIEEFDAWVCRHAEKFEKNRVFDRSMVEKETFSCWCCKKSSRSIGKTSNFNLEFY